MSSAVRLSEQVSLKQASYNGALGIEVAVVWMNGGGFVSERTKNEIERTMSIEEYRQVCVEMADKGKRDLEEMPVHGPWKD